MAYTESHADAAFDAAWSVLERKLTKLNGEQDEAIASAERDVAGDAAEAAPQTADSSATAAAAGGGGAAARIEQPRRRLPSRLAVVPGVVMSRSAEGQLVCQRGEATMRTRLGRLPFEPVDHLISLSRSEARRRVGFRLAELPLLDPIEAVAFCSRLLQLGVLCDASPPPPAHPPQPTCLPQAPAGLEEGEGASGSSRRGRRRQGR